MNLIKYGSSFKYFFIALALLFCFSCSTIDLIKITASTASSSYNLYNIIDEASIFDEHWELLYSYGNKRAYFFLDDDDKKTIENDLNYIADEISDEIRQIEKKNSELYSNRYHSNKRKFPKFVVEVVVSSSAYIYAKQDKDSPKVIVSSAMLVDLVESSYAKLVDQKELIRKNYSHYSDEQLNVKLMEEVSIPRSLEYGDSLRFILSHEAVHLWLDPPLKEKEQTSEIESRADAIGFLLTAETSFVIEKKRELSGIENALISINQPNSIYAPVLRAESGPEFLFASNQPIFMNSNSNGIYLTPEERLENAREYMESSVWENLKTNYSAMILHILKNVE